MKRGSIISEISRPTNLLTELETILLKINEAQGALMIGKELAGMKLLSQGKHRLEKLLTELWMK